MSFDLEHTLVRRMGAYARSILIVTAFATAACHGTAAPGFVGSSLLTPSSDAEVAHDELLRADLMRSDTVAQLGLVDGLTRSFTDDVIYLRGGLPILRGVASARTVIAAESLAVNSGVWWQPVRAETSRDGKAGYSYGYTIYGTSQKGAPAIRIDRYIAFWRREQSTWRIAAYAETYGSPPSSISLPPALGNCVLADVEMSRRPGALDAIRTADIEFSRDATRLGTGEAFGRYAAGEAQIFSGPGELTTGPQAIIGSFGAPARRSTLVWHPVDGEIAGSGDLGFTVGNAVLSGERDDGTPFVRYSKYLTVWKRQRDGSWRYVVDGGSARPDH